MKKQLILLVVSAFILGGSLSSSPAFAGHQPGFSLIISPVLFHPVVQPVMHPVVYQRNVYPHHFGTSYVYTQYQSPARPVKTIGIVNGHRDDREVVYVKHAEPVRINKHRGSHRHSRHW